MSDLQIREAAGGSMEVLDDDGVWRHVPHAAAKFIERNKPADGFTEWEWRIGQVYAAALGSMEDSKHEAVWAIRDNMKVLWPDKIQKFADYMGWKTAALTPNE